MLKRSRSSALGLAAAVCAAGIFTAGLGSALAATPSEKSDVKGKTLYLATGAWLRYSDSLVSRVYTITKAVLQIEGRGACSKRFCPVTHNGVQLWAARTKLDDQKPTVGTIVTERTLRLGDEGSDVKLAQEALVKAGYKIKPDGKFGVDTKRAVEEVQKKSSIDVDGDIGPKTRIALKI